VEEILDPDLVIIDPHQHLYNDANNPFTRRYTFDDFRSDTLSGHRIDHTVYIECRTGYRPDGPEAYRPVGEVEFVVNADPDGLIAGIVGFADLRLPDISDVLAALTEASAGRLRGVRQITAWSPDPELVRIGSRPPHILSDPRIHQGFSALERMGLSFDAWLYHPQIPELTRLARLHPGVTIILDHLGGPLGVGAYSGHREAVIQNWRAAMSELAACSNVLVKLGGFGMPLFGNNWQDHPGEVASDVVASLYGDDIRWCIGTFGAERCMFESNFPVDKISFSYAVTWNSFKRMVSEASASEKQLLFHDTAARAYRI